MLRNVIILVSCAQDIVPVALSLKCSLKGTSEATTVLSLKEGQILSLEGLFLHSPFPPSHLNIHFLRGLTSQLVAKAEKRLGIKEKEKRLG